MENKQYGQESKIQQGKLEIRLAQEEAPGLTLTKAEVVKMVEEAKTEVLRTARNETAIEIDRQVQTDKASLITVFGIFASIISFLTIEFQFLQKLNNLSQIVGFSLVLSTMLLCFNIALDYLVKSRLDKKIPKPHIFFCLIVFVLFGIGIVCAFWGGNEISRESSCQKDSNYFENKLNDFELNYDQKIEIINSRIKLLDEKIDFKI